MKELVEFIAKSLVDNPDAVTVNEIIGEQSIILELKVAQEDMGKIIGKQGRIAKAIRTVIKAVAVKQNKRVIVEIVWNLRVRVNLTLFRYIKIKNSLT